MSDCSGSSTKRRWELVSERLRQESRSATHEDKMAQLESLMSSVDDFGWREKLGADDDRVRALWMKLRLAFSRG
jgi:hypothetical protein